MRIEALKYRTNNLDIIIFVDFDVLSGEHIKRWSIAEIAYKKLLVNKYNFLSDTYCDDDEYYEKTDRICRRGQVKGGADCCLEQNQTGCRQDSWIKIGQDPFQHRMTGFNERDRTVRGSVSFLSMVHPGSVIYGYRSIYGHVQPCTNHIQSCLDFCILG